jgi:hypothetical protein
MAIAIFNRRLLLVIGLVACVFTTRDVQADIVVHEQDMIARQNVNLLGIDAVLYSRGPATFTFDVDANNNTIPGGASNVETLFKGFLPVEFAPLGVAGAAFDLFPNEPDVVEVTGDGTHVRIETTFGLRVYVAPGVVGANFYTAIPSIFESDVVGIQDFTGAVFQDPDRPNDVTEVFIGENIFGIAPGTLVGASFNRTVTAIPEPCSLAFFASLTAVLAFVPIRSRTRRRN